MSHRILCLLGLICALASNPLQAQRWKEMWSQPNRYTFAEIQAEFNAYYATHAPQRGDGYKQFKRWEWYLGSSLDENGKVMNNPGRAWQAAKAMEASASTQRSLDLDGNWTFVGATSGRNASNQITGIGRVNTVAFHPTDPNTLYAGMPAGGIWKSTNHGSTWTALSRNYPFHGVSSIAVHPSAPNTVYIMTGDKNSTGHSRSYGVWKSTDGGNTWQPKTPALNYDANAYTGRKVVIDPTNPTTLYAVLGDGTSSGRGIHRSTDGGGTWTNIASGLNVHDLELHPSTPTTLYAGTSSAVYRKCSTDLDFKLVWTMPAGTNRVLLGVSPASPNTVYGYAGGTPGGGFYNGLFRSNDEGTNWNMQSNTPNIQGYDATGNGSVSISTSAFALAVNPTQVNRVHAGCVWDWTSADGGQTWASLTVMDPNAAIPDDVHMDCQYLAYNNSKLYYCHDGGIHYSTDEGLHWIDISSGLGINEIYRIAGTPASPNLLLAGSQDNGTNKIEGTFPANTMYSQGGGDGMECLIDPGNASIRYLSTWADTSIRLSYSVNGGSNYYAINATNALGKSAWVAPYQLNPRKSSTIVGGHIDVGVYYRAGSGSGWVNLSNGQLGTTIKCKALAMAASDTNTIYVAKDSNLYRTTNYGAQWFNITNGLPPAQNISGIAIDPTNASHVFVSISSWTSTYKVYETTNGGGSWLPLGTGSDLPACPAYCLAYEPGSKDGLYLGTEVGVYYRDDDTGGWTYFSDGLPIIRVTDLDLNPVIRKVRAATYGASVWETDFYLPPCSTASNLSGTITGTVDILVNGVITSTQQLVVPADVLYQSATGIALNAGFLVPPGALFSGEIGPCTVVQGSRTILPDLGLPSPEAAADVAVPVNPLVRLRPNPANEQALLDLELPLATPTRVEVYDLAMRRIATITDGVRPPGTHMLTVPTRDYPSGSYLVRVTLGKEASVHRLVVQH